LPAPERGVSAALAFELPARLEAHEPPEARGLARDEVRLLVATAHDGELVHARFRDLPRFLESGDLLVVNTSATLPASLPARRGDGTVVQLRLSTPAPKSPSDSWWVVELRSSNGAAPFREVAVGDRFELPGGGSAEIVAPEPFASTGARRLWLARLELPAPITPYLRRHGHPIRYGYVRREWPLASYQNTYALEPGSAEMPSAGRPFTPELVTALVARGVLVAPLTLHTGVSSIERGEAPYPERYRVPATTARLVNAVHLWGGRVVAVGTTVVRALETVARPDGAVDEGEGWTSLVITPERGLYAVDGLLTGWHEPEASHLQMLRAAAPDELLDRSYAAALEHGYLWHEFGDSHLLLP
jgi:S-adenosylmethionine:tRNA ribosyltransferase-isomerase